MYNFITNELKIFQNILNDFDKIKNNFNIKNLGINTLNNLKLKVNKKNFLLENICLIRQINEKEFVLKFEKNEFLKYILKNNFFENFGFQIKINKKDLELKIPNLSLEFRENILKILKNEFQNQKELIEFNRKKILNLIKKNFNSLNEIKILENILLKNLIIIKNNLKKKFEEISFKILNE